MKFTCLKRNREMVNKKAGNTEDGLTNTSFSCPDCGNSFGLAANEMESKVNRKLVLHSEAVAAAETHIQWDTDALKRLSKIPDMVRSMAWHRKICRRNGFKDDNLRCHEQDLRHVINI